MGKGKKKGKETTLAGVTRCAPPSGRSISFVTQRQASPHSLHRTTACGALSLSIALQRRQTKTSVISALHLTIVLGDVHPQGVTLEEGRLGGKKSASDKIPPRGLPLFRDERR